MDAIPLTPEQEQVAAELLQRLEPLYRDEAQRVARLFASKSVSETLGKAEFQLRVRRKLSGEDFDRHTAVEARIARLPHFAHPASTERRDDFVRPEACAVLNLHWLKRGLSHAVTNSRGDQGYRDFDDALRIFDGIEFACIRNFCP